MPSSVDADGGRRRHPDHAGQDQEGRDGRDQGGGDHEGADPARAARRRLDQDGAGSPAATSPTPGSAVRSGGSPGPPRKAPHWWNVEATAWPDASPQQCGEINTNRAFSAPVGCPDVAAKGPRPAADRDRRRRVGSIARQGFATGTPKAANPPRPWRAARHPANIDRFAVRLQAWPWLASVANARALAHHSPDPHLETPMPDTPVFASAAVAAPHRLAAAGRPAACSRQGGNAIEAMVAMAATIAVVYPHMNGIGGDGFWLVREPGGRVRGIEACGPAGRLATIPRYREKGYDDDPVARARCGRDGRGRGRRLARSRSTAREALGGRLPLRDAARRRDPPRARRLRGLALRGALRAEGDSTRSTTRRASPRPS